MTVRIRPHLIGLVVAAALVVPAVVAAQGARGDAKKGAAAHVKFGCNGCHMINGKGGNMGPDLSHVGKTMKAADIKKKIEQPKHNMPNSLMPDAKTIGMSAADVANVTAYMVSLK